MIQRIQTIFLLLVAAAFGGLLALPFATSAINDSPDATLFADGRYMVFDALTLELLTGVGILLALISIFLYKRRKMQLRFGYLLIGIALALSILAFFFLSNRPETSVTTSIHLGAGLALPPASIIFALLANHFIRKDDKLIKSMDRLR